MAVSPFTLLLIKKFVLGRISRSLFPSSQARSPLSVNYVGDAFLAQEREPYVTRLIALKLKSVNYSSTFATIVNTSISFILLIILENSQLFQIYLLFYFFLNFESYFLFLVLFEFIILFSFLIFFHFSFHLLLF